jgi:dGTPase
MIDAIDRHYPGLDDIRRGAELVRELISYLISAVMSETRRRLDAAQPASVEDVRNHGRQLVAFSPEVSASEAAIKTFLWHHMYRHPRVMTVMRDAEGIVADLFGRYRADPAALPPEWLQGCEGEGERIRRIGNFIAGMTDRFALTEHHRLFDSTPDLR